MERHLSTGVAMIVALMSAHRGTAGRLLPAEPVEENAGVWLILDEVSPRQSGAEGARGSPTR